MRNSNVRNSHIAGKHLLLIEKDPEVAASHQRYLGSHRMLVTAVTPANTSQFAAALLQNPEVDAVVAEAPEGWSCGQALAALLEKFPNTPIIMQSERGDLSEEVRLLAKGHNVFEITKPCDSRELEDLLDLGLAPDWRKELSQDTKLH